MHYANNNKFKYANEIFIKSIFQEIVISLCLYSHALYHPVVSFTVLKIEILTKCQTHKCFVSMKNDFLYDIFRC